MRTINLTCGTRDDPRYKVALYDAPEGFAATPEFFNSEDDLRQFLGTQIPGSDSEHRINALVDDVKNKGQASLQL